MASTDYIASSSNDLYRFFWSWYGASVSYEWITVKPKEKPKTQTSEEVLKKWM